jgi:hypothetical protein
MKKTIIILSVICLTVISCNSEPSLVDNKVQKAINYMVLLDLSDRLIYPGQANRDIEIIKTVFDEYNTQVRKNLVINSHDKFQVIIASQRGIKYNAERFENAMFIDMGSMNSGVKINKLVEFGKDLPVTLKELYSVANLGNKTSDYPGAGIWQFFNENLEYLAEEKYENYLVIITDGYFDLEDYSRQLPVVNRVPTTSFLSNVRNNISWREIMEEKNMGLLPVKKEFMNLKVFVSELSPKYDFQYESDMLIYVWTKWCKEMNVAGLNVFTKTSLPQAISLLRNKLNSDS